MQYLYLVGVGIILFFGFMFVTEQLLLKQRSKSPVVPANPTPPPKPAETAPPRQKDKKKGRRR